MCSKICDCNNCFKKDNCVRCQYQEQQLDKINCLENGLQGCPYRVDDVTRPHTVKGA
jgi:hypothetical protein